MCVRRATLPTKTPRNFNITHMRPHTPPYLQSEDSEEDGSDGTEGRVVEAELVAKDMEELTALREAWGGLPAGPAKVAAREAYF